MELLKRLIRNRLVWKKRISVSLACIVVFVTVYAMVLPAITLDQDTAGQDDGIAFDNENEDAQWDAEDVSDAWDSFGEEEDEEDAWDDVQWPLTLTWTSPLPEEEETEETEEKEPEQDYSVTATVYENSGLPGDVTLQVREIEKGTEEYEYYLKSALEAVSSDDESSVTEISYARFFDITFVNDEGEFEPDGPVSIVIDYKEEKEEEEEAEEKEEKADDGQVSEDISVVHFEKENMEEPVLMEIETEEKEDQVQSVSFDSDAFSVYGVVRTYTVEITGEVQTGDEHLNYAHSCSLLGGESILLSELLEAAWPERDNLQIEKVTEVTAGDDASEADAAEGTENSNIVAVFHDEAAEDYRIEALAGEEDLAGRKGSLKVLFEDGSSAVFEITIGGTPEVDTGLAVISSSSGIYLPEETEGSAEEVTGEELSLSAEKVADTGNSETVTRVFDISLNLTQEEQASYEEGFLVNLTLPEEVTGRDFHLYHIHDGRTEELAIEKTGSVLDESGLETVSGIQFVTDSFSEFVLQYTVDFHWEVDGKKFQLSIPGGTFVSFTKLMEVLGVAEDDKQNDSEKSPAVEDDQAVNVLTLNDVEVSGKTKAFVAEVEKVEFSSPELLSVSKAEDDTTVGAIKDRLGLECDYSAELTQEQIAELNAVTVAGGDWALISLKAFDTEEELTVTMKNGEVFTIRVTDARDPLGLDGRTFAIARKLNNTACEALYMKENPYWYLNLATNRTANISFTYSTVEVGDSLVEYCDARATAFVFEYDPVSRAYYISNGNGTYLTFGPYENAGAGMSSEHGFHYISGKARAVPLKIEKDEDGNYIISYTFTNGETYYLTRDVRNSNWHGFHEQNSKTDEAKLRFCLPEENGSTASHKATMISAADTQPGQKIIVYQRVLDPATDTFTYYAINGLGGLEKVYESSDSIYWKGDKSIEWTLNDLGNGYCTLYNESTQTYLTPKAEKGVNNSYIIHAADDFTGEDAAKHLNISLPGRDDGAYTSLIACWDYDEFVTYGIEVSEVTAGVQGKVEAKPLLSSQEFYFAARDPIVHDQLTTVAAVDNVAKGIKITMYDWGNPTGSDAAHNSAGWDNYTGSNKIQTRLDWMQGIMGTDSDYYETRRLEQGIASRLLDPDTLFPDATKPGTGNIRHNLSELFADQYITSGNANGLFLKNVYDETGFYKYSSFENYAYLPGGDNFVLYEQIGTPSTRGTTNPGGGNYSSINNPPDYLKIFMRGNFTPYNKIDPQMKYRFNEYDQNLNRLNSNDPRYNERLYFIENANPTWSPNPEASTNYFFGMTIDAKFNQNPGGIADKGDPMVFEFNGDDDMWVYIDNVLVLDIGGIHDAFHGRINFRTGEVKVYAAGNADIIGNDYDTTIREMFKKAGQFPDGSDWNENKVEDYFTGNTFKDFSTHDFRMIYMERGASASTLEVMFNLPILEDSQFRVRKELPETQSGEKIQSNYGDAPFYYVAYVWDGIKYVPCTRSYLASKGLDNPVYEDEFAVDEETNEKVPVPVEWLDNSNDQMIFLVRPGQTAVFPAIDDTVQWYAVEVSPPDNTGMLERFAVTNSDVDNNPADNPNVNQYDTSYREGTKSNEKTIKKRNLVRYENRPGDDLVNDLQIKKRVNGTPYHDSDTFEYRILLEKRDGTLGAYRLGAYYQYDKDGRFVFFDGRDRYTALVEKYPRGRYRYYDFRKDDGTPATYDGQTEVVLDELWITEHTSSNGSLGNVRDGDTILVKGLLVGTDFYVYERTNYNYMSKDGNFHPEDWPPENLPYEQYVFEGTEVTDAYLRTATGIVNPPENEFVQSTLYGAPDQDALAAVLDFYGASQYERSHAASGAITEEKDAKILVKNKPYLEKGVITVEKKWFDEDGEETSPPENAVVHYDIYRLVHIHEWTPDESVPSVPPEDDTHDGMQTFKCRHEGCTARMEIPISAPGHAWSEWTANPAATCLESGYWERHCTNPGCSASESWTEPPTGHDWMLESVTPSTIFAAGSKHYVCRNDPTHTYDEPIAKLTQKVKYYLRNSNGDVINSITDTYTNTVYKNGHTVTHPSGLGNAIRVSYSISGYNPADTWTYGNQSGSFGITASGPAFMRVYNYTATIPFVDGNELTLYLAERFNNNVVRRNGFKIEIINDNSLPSLTASRTRSLFKALFSSPGAQMSLRSAAPAGPTSNAALNEKLNKVGYIEVDQETQTQRKHMYYTVAKYDSATQTWKTNGVSTETLEDGHWSQEYTVEFQDENGYPYEYYFAETQIEPDTEGENWKTVYSGTNGITLDGQKTKLENHKIPFGALTLKKAVTVGGTEVTGQTPAYLKNKADGTYVFTLQKLVGDTDEIDTGYEALTIELTITNGQAAETVLGKLPVGNYLITETDPQNGTALSGVTPAADIVNGSVNTDGRSAKIKVEKNQTAAAHIVTFTNDLPTTTVTVQKTWNPVPTEEGAYAIVELHRYAPVTKGTLGITLLDQNGDPVQGAVFMLYKLNAETNEYEPEGTEVTTDADGKAAVTGLLKGSYKLIQTSAPEGYIMPGQHAPESGVLTVEDVTRPQIRTSDVLRNETTAALGTIKVTLKDDLGNAIPGAVFTLYQLNEETEIFEQTETTVTTDENGIAQATWLRKGTYFLLQTSTLPAYKLPAANRTENFTVPETVGWRETQETEFVNTRKPEGKFTLTLKDNRGVPIQGAAFDLYKDGSIWKSLETDAEGVISEANLEEGVYYFVQTTTADVYKLPVNPQTESYNVNVPGLTEAEAEVINYYKGKGTITVVLKKQNDNSPIAGSTFQLKQGKTVVDTGITDSNGQIVFPKQDGETQAWLGEGIYTIHQVTTADGYLVDENDQDAEIVEGDPSQSITRTFTNKERPNITHTLRFQSSSDNISVEYQYFHGTTVTIWFDNNDNLSNPYDGITLSGDVNDTIYDGNRSFTVVMDSDKTITLTETNASNWGDVVTNSLNLSPQPNANAGNGNNSSNTGNTNSLHRAARSYALPAPVSDKAPSESLIPVKVTVQDTAPLMLAKAPGRGVPATEYVNPTPTPPAGYAEDADFRPIESERLNSSNNWNYVFPAQPKYTPDGELYYYYIVEKEWSPEEYVIGSYSAEHGITQDGTITVTNLAGSLKIQKTLTLNGQQASAANASLMDGVFTFTVTGGSPAVTKTVTITFVDGTATSATINGSAVTVTDGVVQVNRLKPGTYSVTEDTTSPGAGGFTLVGQGTQTVEVTVGESATIRTASFTNNKNLVDINIEKNDGRGSSLAGAVFQLKSVNGMTESLATEIGGIEGIGTVVKRVDGSNKTFESAFETTDGVTTLSRLPDGTYRLYEVYVPDGYICTFRYIQFSIEDSVMKNVTTDAGDSDNLQFTAANGNNLALLGITNQPGAALPHTGGSGTSLIHLLGILLTGLAGAVLMRRMGRRTA